MLYAAGDTYRDEVYVYDSNGALVAPDSVDAAVLVVNGADTAAAVTTDTTTAGVIKVSSSLAGRAVGDVGWVRLTATVGGTQQIIRTEPFRIAALATSGYFKTDLQAIDGDITLGGLLTAMIVAYNNSTFAVKSVADGVTVGGYAAGQAPSDQITGYSTHAAADVAAAILANPANKLATAAGGTVQSSLVDGAITALKLADSAVAKIEAALINEGDGQALINAIVQAIDAADISTNLTVALIRDGILNRVLAGNHDAAGTVGQLLQLLTSTSTLTQAQAQTAALAALDSYDPPTWAELDAMLAALNDPTAAQIADAVWDEATAGHATAGTFGAAAISILAAATHHETMIEPSGDAYRYTGDALALAPGSTGGLTPEEKTQLSETHSMVMTIGGGSNPSFTWTITDTDGLPIDGVAVRISTDAAGSHVIEGPRYTDSLGRATFYSLVDGGTYYRWAERAGYNFVNPQPFTAVAD